MLGVVVTVQVEGDVPAVAANGVAAGVDARAGAMSPGPGEAVDSEHVGPSLSVRDGEHRRSGAAGEGRGRLGRRGGVARGCGSYKRCFLDQRYCLDQIVNYRIIIPSLLGSNLVIFSYAIIVSMIGEIGCVNDMWSSMGYEGLEVLYRPNKQKNNYYLHASCKFPCRRLR